MTRSTYCSACGVKLEPGVRFCYDCGTDSAAEPAAMPASPRRPTSPLAPDTAPPPRPPLAAAGPARRKLALVVGCIVLLAVAGAAATAIVSKDDGGGTAVSVPVDAPPDVTPSAPTPPPVSSQVWSADRTYEWEVEGSNGTTATLVLGMGELVKAGSATVPADFAKLAVACEMDTQRDAVVPVRLSATNTVDGFDVKLNVNMRLSVSANLDLTLGFEAATQFSSGASCGSATGGTDITLLGVQFDPIAPQATAHHDWLLVIHNYYTPDNPDGNEDELALYVGVLSGGDGAGTLATTCFEGPERRVRYKLNTFSLFVLRGSLPLADVDTDPEPFTQDNPPEC